MNKEIATLLRERAMLGRMTIKDKQLMLEAAEKIEKGETDVINQIFQHLDDAINLNDGRTPTEAYFSILNAITEIKNKYKNEGVI